MISRYKNPRIRRPSPKGVHYEVVLGSAIFKGLHLKEESLAEPVSDRGEAPRSSRQEKLDCKFAPFQWLQCGVR
jgi:hypothetical protein